MPLTDEPKYSGAIMHTLEDVVKAAGGAGCYPHGRRIPGKPYEEYLILTHFEYGEWVRINGVMRPEWFFVEGEDEEIAKLLLKQQGISHGAFTTCFNRLSPWIVRVNSGVMCLQPELVQFTIERAWSLMLSCFELYAQVPDSVTSGDINLGDLKSAMRLRRGLSNLTTSKCRGITSRICIPPELIVQLPPLLSPNSLRALVLTCRRLNAILQPELEAALTPELGRVILFEAVEAGKIDTVAKLLAPPHLINPNIIFFGSFSKRPLHVAVKFERRDIVALLLKAGADVRAEWSDDGYQPLHLAAFNQDLEMMKLLLEHGAPVNSLFVRDVGYRQSTLHYACERGNLEMGRLLLDYGADLEFTCARYGTALSYAVLMCDLDMVLLLLQKGANTEVSAPLFKSNLLYAAIRLHLSKKFTAVLLAYGASRNTTMEGILQSLTTLARGPGIQKTNILQQ
ncbi:ankyrin repeat-containing domain protein [Rhodocollybia butyracea]|uniref:Ankyrin repeat-containing domain protein n=1 Tax=Rhodocollybia butyracea TaxID=206335 RepID=A0A9P5U3Z7_9AGAR|nr:ankyrin repeat-containing domain protein [Rhodocollybia butyracea]